MFPAASFQRRPMQLTCYTRRAREAELIPMPESNLVNSIYDELGVRTVIHAGGATTNYGGSRMLPETLDAYVAASRSFVSIVELNQRAGAYIAQVTGAEDGMITSGAAGGMVLSIAACMTGADVAAARRLPDATGLKDELIIQKFHRGPYSHMYTFCGVRFVEVGDSHSCLPEELEAAFSERTAAVAFLIAPGTHRGGLSLPEVAKIAHGHGVPVIVDAAMTVPPRDNLRRFIREGADLVTMSGGKVIRGPQDTGLLYGRGDLIEAARVNNSPNHAIGRPHKVSRESMLALYTALKLYMDSDEDEMLHEFGADLEPLLDDLGELDGLRVSLERDDDKHFVPTLVIGFTRAWTGAGPLEIQARLLAGQPSIFLGYDQAAGRLNVNPINLQEGEAAMVGRRLREELTAG